MKKSDNIIFWIGIFLIILTNVLTRQLSDLDEMWNFNIARCIANGLVPYRDISMVSTPLLGFISAPFLKIFGAEMFVTRILTVFLSVGVFSLIYCILNKIGIKKVISKIIILVMALLINKYFNLDYNLFTLFLALIIILLELKNHKENKIYKNIIIGILGGLCVCTKQSIGLFICLAIVTNGLFFIKEKKDIKVILKNIGFKIIGIIIPIAIFVIYLLINNAFNDFLNYSVYGISTFTNYIPYINLIKSDVIGIKIFSIIIPLIIIASIIINIVKKCLKKEDSFLYILTIYSIPLFVMVFPIADKIHFIIGMIPAVIIMVYMISLLVKKVKFLNNENIFEFLNILCTLGILISTLYIETKNYNALSNLSKYKKINHLRYITTSSSFSNSIEKVNEFINTSDKKVYILDASAAVYMIPNERYNKNYDMFLKGNLGTGGESAQIENIKNEDALYLIMKDEFSRNWQNPEEVRSYIKENLNRIGEIEMFDIYENKIQE